MPNFTLLVWQSQLVRLAAMFLLSSDTNRNLEVLSVDSYGTLQRIECICICTAQIPATCLWQITLSNTFVTQLSLQEMKQRIAGLQRKMTMLTYAIPAAAAAATAVVAAAVLARNSRS